MKVLNAMELHGTDREVKCPNGGFISIRMLIKKDGMGFTMTRTTVHPTKEFQMWNYKHHLEACYCIRGHGTLKNAAGKTWEIKPGIFYALDKHDQHYFKAKDTVILICTLTPALEGHEVHQPDGSYKPSL